MSNKSLRLNSSTLMQICGIDLSHLNLLDLTELESIRNKIIEDLYTLTLTEFERRSIESALDFISALMEARTGASYLLNSFTLPSEAHQIVYTEPRKPKVKHNCNFAINDYSELLVKIFRYRIEFHKIGTTTHQPFTLKELKLSGGKLDILKEFSYGHYYKRNDTTTSRISELNAMFSDLFGLEQYPFTWNEGVKKYRISLVKIEVYDHEESFLESTLKADRHIVKNPIGMHLNHIDEEYQENAMQEHLRIEDIDEDDILV
jgi:hypothetical protein